MQNSKLIELLRSLSKRKLSRFQDFIRSPYFNKNTDIISFFEYLKKYSPSFNHKNLNKEIVIKKVKTTKKLNDRTLAYLMNNLLTLLEEFLSVEQLIHDPFKTQFNLLREYDRLHLQKHYKSALDKSKKLLASNKSKDAEYYSDLFSISQIEYENSSAHQKNYGKKLQKAADDLDIYYLIEKLRFCWEMQNRESILNVDFELKLGNQLVGWANEHGYSNIPTISVYLNILNLIEADQDYDLFVKVKKLINKHETLFKSEELLQLYTGLLNYCTRQINRYNDEQYLHEYLEINKLLLENDLLFDDGLLSPWRYANLVNVGLKTNQIEWTKTFIEEYKEKLPKDYVENMYAYNLAMLHHHQKDYEKAQTLAFQIDPKDILLNILNRSLLIKIYYETDQIELLLFYLEANRIFLLRNKLIDPKLKKQMQRFVDFTKKLAKIEHHESEKLEPLKNKIPEASQVMHKDWLLDQIEKKIENFS